MLAFLAAFLEPILARVGFRGILIGAAVIAVGVTVWRIYDAGGDAREAAIAEQNQRAERTGAAAARDVTECYALGEGYRWDVTTGTCRAP